MKSNLEDIEVHMHAQTEKAVRVSVDGNDEHAAWVPKSLCEIEHKRGRIWVLTAEQNLLEEKGLV